MQLPRPLIRDPLLAPSAPEYQPPAVGPPTWRPPAAASSQWCPSLWPLWAGRSSAVISSLVSQRLTPTRSLIDTIWSDEIIVFPLPTGTTTKITTIPMTSKPNVIVVQKTTGKGATIQGLPGKNVVTTLLNAGVSQTTLRNNIRFLYFPSVLWFIWLT